MRAFMFIVSLFVVTTAGRAAQATPSCDAPDLRRSLTRMSASAGLEITRQGEQVIVSDRARDRILFRATAQGVSVPEPEALRPLVRRQAATEVVRDVAGRRLYSLSLTPFGARLLLIEPGVIGPEGLQLIAFDDDDVHVSDGLGALIFERHTAADGSLVLSDGRCERRVDAEGLERLTPLKR